MHTSIDVSITSKELIQSHLYSGVQSLGVQAKKKTGTNYTELEQNNYVKALSGK